MNALRDMLLNFILNTLDSFDDMTAESVAILSEGELGWGLVVDLTEALKPVCLVIITICLLIELAQVLSKVDILKWEHGLKVCVKLVLAKVMIDNAPTLLKACFRQAIAWMDVVVNAPLAGAANLYDLASTTVVSLVNSVSGLWAVLGLFISVFIVVLAIKLCGIIIKVIAYGRLFELYVYLAISPLPCAFFPLGTGDGGGFSRITGKFLRSFAAICLQGVMMVTCMRVFGVIINSALTAAVNNAASLTGAVAVSEVIFALLVGTIVLVMSVVKSGSWAKSILDAT